MGIVKLPDLFTLRGKLAQTLQGPVTTSHTQLTISISHLSLSILTFGLSPMFTEYASSSGFGYAENQAGQVPLSLLGVSRPGLLESRHYSQRETGRELSVRMLKWGGFVVVAPTACLRGLNISPF